MSTRYPVEVLDEDEDDGTMPENVEKLASQVVGHKIVSIEKRGDLEMPEDGWWHRARVGLVLTLDNGHRVALRDTSDCCAYTEVKSFLLHPELVDHFIAGVGTTDGYERWHIYADAGDILELEVGWSSGNPFYYAYGFSIDVLPIHEAKE